MRYFFPNQFIDEIENPVVGKISPNYTIGEALATVLVELLSEGRSYTVTLEGFDNTQLWGDPEIIAWVNAKLIEFEVE